jgi:hypothetical protein
VRGPLRVTGAQYEPFEVVVREVALSGNQRERETLRAGEEVSVVARFYVSFPWKIGGGGPWVRDADVYSFYYPWGGRGTLRGIEEGQLADPAAGAHEGVAVGAVDDVEAEVRGQEPGGRFSVSHVERYVIQLLYLHVSPSVADRFA